MKIFINKIKTKYVFLPAVLLLAGALACSDPNLPFDLDGSLNNNGAYLRVLKYDHSAFDLADIANAKFAITVEYYDGEVNPLLEKVDFYAKYTSFSLTPGNDSNQVILDETSSPILSVPASSFSKNENGLLGATIEIPLATVTDALNLDINDLGVEDRFGIRWVVNTTDGRSYTDTDISAAVAGGFFKSPYFSNVFTVQALPETKFVGMYEFTQKEPGALEGLGLSWLFGETFNAELSIDDGNSLNGRVFKAEPYPDFGGLDELTIPISIGRTATVTGSSIGTGLGCGIGLRFGPASRGLVEIDVNDDSEFTLVISENTEADCDVGPKTITYTVTKL